MFLLKLLVNSKISINPKIQNFMKPSLNQISNALLLTRSCFHEWKDFYLDPLKLKVGMEYNLNNVKEILPTDDFLTLDRNIIKCQIEESLNDCKTRQFQDTVVDQCGCLPFSMGNFNQVSLNIKCKD